MPEVGQWGPEPFLDRRGRPLTVLTISVYETDGTTLATLYDDQSGTTTLANPLPIGVPTTEAGLDVRGNGSFYAEAGPYELVAVRDGLEVYRSPITISVDTVTAGPSGSSYTHNQGVASAVWTIPHGLGYRPGGVIVIDSGGTEWIGEPAYPDANTLTLTFTTAFGGTAYIS